jgi:hypothetical protein
MKYKPETPLWNRIILLFLVGVDRVKFVARAEAL